MRHIGAYAVRTMSWFRRMAPPARAGLDAASWIPAYLLATWLRYDFNIGPNRLRGAFSLALFAAVLQILIGLASGLYRNGWRYGTIEEVGAMSGVAAVVGGSGVLINRMLLGHRAPISATILAIPLALACMLAARYWWRASANRATRNRRDLDPVIVFGAGNGGHQVVTALLGDRSSPFRPAAVLDDDPRRRNLRVRGVAVRGTRQQLARVAAETGATHLIIAIPSADSSLIRELANEARQANLVPLVLPPVSDLFGRIGVSDIRPLTEADLLGRHEVTVNFEAIASMIANQRVLVTGAGGSIGSELCRQVLSYAPAELVMVDHDDSALHALQLKLTGRALLDDNKLVLANIRDLQRMKQVFKTHRPQVVFHAAALKHLSLLQSYPSEGYQTNVLGTLNVLEAASSVGVDRFVNVSTDKAASPISVLGQTKRIAERMTAGMAATSPGIYLSVRFGNVLGSRGSVLPTFRHQIAAGGPLTVTHPEATRFFMTVEEAVRLVLCAATFGGSGETLVLDMGDPVRISEVAEQLVAESERPIEVVYTGLRSGEKLHEQLLDLGCVDDRRAHPKISHTQVEPLSPDEVGRRGACDDHGYTARVEALLDQFPRLSEPEPPQGSLLDPVHSGSNGANASEDATQLTGEMTPLEDR